MKGCWAMWLGDCCMSGCWCGLCSCWENWTGCRAAKLPATLLMTGTLCACEVFRPGGRDRAGTVSAGVPSVPREGVRRCPGGVLTLCDGHDSRERRHDEVLGLLRVVVGQAVDVGQGAHRRQPAARHGDLPRSNAERDIRHTARAAPGSPTPPGHSNPKNRDGAGWKKPLRAKQAAATLGTFQ